MKFASRAGEYPYRFLRLIPRAAKSSPKPANIAKSISTNNASGFLTLEIKDSTIKKAPPHKIKIPSKEIRALVAKRNFEVDF